MCEGRSFPSDKHGKCMNINERFILVREQNFAILRTATTLPSTPPLAPPQCFARVRMEKPAES